MRKTNLINIRNRINKYAAATTNSAHTLTVNDKMGDVVALATKITKIMYIINI